MKIHHIGIIVKDVEKSLILYTKLGFKRITDVVEDMVQHNIIVFLGLKNGSPIIELIQPLDEHSSVINSHVGYHHICFEADPQEDIVSKFKSIGIGKIFAGPIVAPAIDNRKVAFACMNNGTFIELILKGDCDEYDIC